MTQFSSVQLTPPNGTELLCKNLLETGFSDLSEENVEIFRDRLLDMTGCIFGGAIVKEDAFLIDLVTRWGGVAEAPVFAHAARIPAVNAVAVNSILARANDFGNMVSFIHGERIASHFGESLIPMNLTFADIYKTSGEEFITRNVAAEDAMIRVLYTLPDRWPVDMHLGSSIAAALAARIYGLTPEQTKAALSFAATNNSDPGNAYFDYSQEFKLHNGESARVGVLACELAKNGWRGLEDPFFGHWGLITNHLKDGRVLPALYEKAFEGLGKVYFTESSFKRSPGGIPTTAAGNLGKELRAKIIEKYGRLDPAQIRRVHVFRSSSMRDNYYAQPFTLRNHTNALFCYRFSVCCCLLKGACTVRDVQTDTILSDPQLISLAENATMDVYDCAPGSQMMKAVVDMADGSSITCETDYIGSMYAYPSKEFLREKFLDQFRAFGRLPENVGQKIIELAGRVEQLDDMREFTELLVLKA